MEKILETIKGIHPGLILERELKKRNLKKGPFAISLNEYPQTLVSITKGKRRMNPGLSLKIEEALGFEEGFLMTLQVFHDIREIKKKKKKSLPDLTKLRPVLFWDTELEGIDWEGQRDAIIKRVLERGNETEKNEIMRFYGKAQVRKIQKLNENQASL
jgi:plasmid maintenance system antidote protein VapI